MKLVLVGMNHTTSPLEVRERFALDDPSEVLDKLGGSPDIEEAVVISTCNRVEIVAATRASESAAHTIRHYLRDAWPNPASRDPLPEGAALDDFLYTRVDARAVRHLFRVAASMDSMVVGEPQIVGQVKDAYQQSVDADACGPVLARLFQHAFATAKRVRNETRIAERPVSVARVAVDLARQIFESLEDKRALLVGAGDMIELAIEALRGEGLGRLRVANRTVARAQGLAERYDASAHGLDELDALLPDSDVVLTCIGGAEHAIDEPRMRAALRARRGRPTFLIDIGVPRNIAPDVNALDGAYLYDIDDLQQVAAQNASERQRETERGEAIVLAEQERFEGWLTALQAVPTIRDLRARADAIRTNELERTLRRLELGGAERDAVEHLTKAIVNKILHPPLSRLRDESSRSEGLAMLEAARALFALDGDDEAGTGPEGHEQRRERRALASVDPEEKE